MSILTINVNNKNFQLSCDDDGKEELLGLVAKLNKRIATLKNDNPTASFELLLVMCGLGLEEEIQDLSEKVEQLDHKKNLGEVEGFSETLTTMAGYLENLAKKIGK